MDEDDHNLPDLKIFFQIKKKAINQSIIPAVSNKPNVYGSPPIITVTA
jgi:hypothetical protein